MILKVAPFVAMVDRSIIENASGKKRLIQSLKHSILTMITKPHQFIFSPAYRLVFMVYSCTYFSANLVDTTSNIVSKNPDLKHQNNGIEKFLATSGTNMILGVYKDCCLTRCFGQGVPRPLPLPSYAFFVTRDALTIAASFNLPPLLAAYFPGGLNMAQLVSPCALQFVSTPFHLLGLDLYNRRKENWRERFEQVRREYWRSSFARIGRILPAFGFGGITNRDVRNWCLE